MLLPAPLVAFYSLPATWVANPGLLERRSSSRMLLLYSVALQPSWWLWNTLQKRKNDFTLEHPSATTILLDKKESQLFHTTLDPGIERGRRDCD